MASALSNCIQIATAVPTGLWEVSTQGSESRLALATVSASNLRLGKSSLQGLKRSTKTAAAGVDSISQFRISCANSHNRPKHKETGDGVATSPRRQEISSQVSSIPTVNTVGQHELAGLSKEERLEAIAEKKLAHQLNEELLEQPTYLESQGKGRYHPYSHLHIGERWEEIQGKYNWDGLLDPLDNALRGEVMRYGELAQAAYDGFDYDTHSRFCGSCRFNKKRLLEKVGLANRGYEVTNYLYATSGVDHPVANFFKIFDRNDDEDGSCDDDIWDKASNWMGFVAVTTDEEEIARLGRRDIVVVWRGTVTNLEWLENLRDYMAPGGFDPLGSTGLRDIKVEAGFLNVYMSKNPDSQYTKKCAREQVHNAVRKLVEKYKAEKLSITITGHSLGSALAHLCAYDLAENDFHFREGDPKTEDHSIPITVYSYAGPRVGNDAYRDRMEELGVKVLRVVNRHDRVPKLPGILINENLDILEKKAKFLWNIIERLPWTYTHCGVVLEVNNHHSPYLKKPRGPLNPHNLEAYIHLVNGYQGKKKKFELAIQRSISLINKNSDFVKPKHFIPPAWRTEENKGVIRTEDGHWKLRGRHPEDEPHDEDQCD